MGPPLPPCAGAGIAVVPRQAQAPDLVSDDPGRRRSLALDQGPSPSRPGCSLCSSRWRLPPGVFSESRKSEAGGDRKALRFPRLEATEELLQDSPTAAGPLRLAVPRPRWPLSAGDKQQEL